MDDTPSLGRLDTTPLLQESSQSQEHVHGIDNVRSTDKAVTSATDAVKQQAHIPLRKNKKSKKKRRPKPDELERKSDNIGVGGGKRGHVISSADERSLWPPVEDANAAPVAGIQQISKLEGNKKRGSPSKLASESIHRAGKASTKNTAGIHGIQSPRSPPEDMYRVIQYDAPSNWHVSAANICSLISSLVAFVFCCVFLYEESGLAFWSSIIIFLSYFQILNALLGIYFRHRWSKPKHEVSRTGRLFRDADTARMAQKDVAFHLGNVSPPPSPPAHPKWYKITLRLHLISAALLFLGTAVGLVLAATAWTVIGDYFEDHASPLPDKQTHRQTYVILLSCNILTTGYTVFAAAFLAYAPPSRPTRGLLLISNTFMFVFAMLLVALNRRVSHYHTTPGGGSGSSTNGNEDGPNPKLAVRGAFYSSILAVAVSLLGLLITWLSKGRGRNVGSLPIVYFSLAVIGAIVSLAFTLFNSVYMFTYSESDHVLRTTQQVNFVFGIFLVGLYITVGTAVYVLRSDLALPLSGLATEVIQLKAVPKRVSDMWARNMDRVGGLRHVGAWDGASIIEMMKMYERVDKIDTVDCMIVRVFDPRPRLSVTSQNNTTGKKAAGAAATEVKRNPIGSKAAVGSRPGDDDDALWRFAEQQAQNVLGELDSKHKKKQLKAPDGKLKKDPGATRRKNAKRRAKKLRAAGRDAEADEILMKAGIGNANGSPKDEEEKKHAPMGEKTLGVEPPSPHGDGFAGTTIALVIVTSIKYDLMHTMRGRLGRMMSYMFGLSSRLPLLTCRLALVGFHWPFHSGVFLCYDPEAMAAEQAAHQEQGDSFVTSSLLQQHRDVRVGGRTNRAISVATDVSPFYQGVFTGSEVPRQVQVRFMTAVLLAIAEWNDTLPKSLRATIMLAPSFLSESLFSAFLPAGYSAVMLSPTSMLDLRAVRGKTWKQYLKTLRKSKRRDYDRPFHEAGGAIQYIPAIGSEGAATCMHLWQKIADFRDERKEVPTLFTPDVTLFESIAAMPSRVRCLQMLSVQGKPVGTATLFRFPKARLLTTDLQGLDHGKVARDAKAYFVMLQRCARLALEAGYDFVDFGPTTEGPKTGVGARLVGVAGGFHTTSVFMRIMMTLSTSTYVEKMEATD